MRPKALKIILSALLMITLLGIIITHQVSAEAPRVIEITAKRFAFTPNQITLKKGEPVVLVISSEDRKHGFNLRAFGVRTDVNPGGSARIRLTPDKTGKFTFSCDVFCGEGHEDMTGTIVVTE